MVKKDLNNAVADLLGGQQKQATPQRIKRDARSRSRAALASAVDKNAAGYEAVTISVNSVYYAKIKEIAFAENLTIIHESDILWLKVFYTHVTTVDSNLAVLTTYRCWHTPCLSDIELTSVCNTVKATSSFFTPYYDFHFVLFV